MKTVTALLAFSLIASVAILATPGAAARHACLEPIPDFVCCHGTDCIVEEIRADVKQILRDVLP